MLTIRLTRKGKKNQPFFRVVLIDKRASTKGGRSVEDLGYVDPLKKRKSLNKERIIYWISKGAKTSDTVNNLLISEKIIEGKKIHVSKLSKKKLAEIETKKAEEKAKASANVKAMADKEAEEAKPVEEVKVEEPKEDVKPAEQTKEELTSTKEVEAPKEETQPE